MTYTFVTPTGAETESSVPYGGYDYETLQDMEGQGHKLFIDGKEVKFPTAAQVKKAQNAYQAPKKQTKRS